MAWTYHDWASQSTTALRLTRLRLHKQEVASAIGPAVSADGKSKSTGDILAYYNALAEEEKLLMSMPDAGGAVAGGVSLASFEREPDAGTRGG